MGAGDAANVFIDSINHRFGEAIPPVDVARVASHDPLVNNPFRPVAEPPFGLIGDDSDEIAGWAQDAFDRVESRAEELGRDATGAGRDFFKRLRRFFRDVFRGLP